MNDRHPASTTTPRLNWDLGTAYDFFNSLDVLHDPDQYGLRPSWAAGVRSRLPAAERKLLEEMQSFVWVPFQWVNQLPEPKDAATALWALRQTPPAERLVALTSVYEMGDLANVFKRVGERRSWDKSDVEAIKEHFNQHGKKEPYVAQYLKSLPTYLDWWTRPEEFGELYLSALQAYYQVFFAEEEKRIAPSLETALQRAKELSERLSLPELLLELSQGVHFDQDLNLPEIMLVPVYWSTPLILYGKVSPDRMMFLFGARPADASLIPGEVIPDAMLRTLKALADPTRLQILRYLNEEMLTPAQLSRRLRLRAPTVIHHLDALRLAGLVQLSVDSEHNKRYAARGEAIQITCDILREFLQVGEKEKI
jgi:DNA-binding transcriptional ArsR family regulator